MGLDTLVGRDQEMADLRALLRGLSGGRARASLLVGEAGIGKTALLDWFTNTAIDLGVVTVAGRQSASEQDRPFGAWIRALSTASVCAPVLARLREAEEIDWRAAAPSTRFQLVDELVSAIGRLAGRGPLLVVLDDYQWTDELSRLVCGAALDLTDTAPLALVLATRPQPGDDGIAELEWRLRRRGALRIDLTPLTAEDHRVLVRQAFGAPPGPRFDSYLAAAGGNAFLLTEILAEVCRDDVVAQLDGQTELTVPLSPTALRTTVHRHLTTVDAHVRDLLRLACLLGDPFTLDDLAAGTGTPLGEVSRRLRPALDARLVDGTSNAGLRFRHDLIRDALYEDLAPAVRRSLHGHVGQTLAARGADPLTVARHLSAAAIPPDPETAGWLRRAAHQVGGTSPSTAVRLLRQALSLVGTDEAGALLVGADLVTMLLWDGELAEARSLAEELAPRAADEADIAGRLRLALGIAVFAAGETTAAAEVFLAGSEDPALSDAMRACLTGWAAWLTGVQLGDASRGLPLAAVAVEQGRRHGEPLGELFGLLTQATLAYLGGDLDTASALGEQVLSVANAPAPSAVRQQPAHVVAGMIEADRDRRELSLRILRDGRRMSEEHGARWNLGIYHWVEALRHYLFGEWDDSLADIADATELAQQLGASLGWVVGHATGALIQLHQGRLDLAAASLNEAQEHLHRRGPEYRWYWVVWARALLHRANGSKPEATALLAELWDQCVQLGVLLDLPLFAADLVRLLLSEGDRSRLPVILETLTGLPAAATVPSVQAAVSHCTASSTATSPASKGPTSCTSRRTVGCGPRTGRTTWRGCIWTADAPMTPPTGGAPR